MPTFTNSLEDRAFEQLMKRVPNFEPGQGSQSFWPEEYPNARELLYGTDAIESDLESDFLEMADEAEWRNPLAMHDLGVMLLKGMTCEKDKAQAEDWLSKALAGFLESKRTAEKMAAHGRKCRSKM